MKYVALTGKVAECESGESVGCLPADSVYEVQQCLNAIHVVPAESYNAILVLPIIYIRKTIGNLQWLIVKLIQLKREQDCSYQGEALNIPTAF